VQDNSVAITKLYTGGAGVNRLLITDNVSGNTVTYSTCGLNQVLAWSAIGWTCTTPVISVNGSTGVVVINAGNLPGLGSIATFNQGTGAGQVVALDGSARFPAVDGSQLLNTVGVKNVATGNGLSGGPITSTGTIVVNTGTGSTQIPQLGAGGQLALARGLVSAPNYSFVGDLTSGIYSPGAGTIAFALSGVERARITDTGLTLSNAMTGNGVNGMVRYNTDSTQFEVYQGGTWMTISTSGGWPGSPTTGSCGGGSVLAGSTDGRGRFTFGTSGSTDQCIVNFSRTYATVPVCVVVPSSSSSFPDRFNVVTNGGTGFTVNTSANVPNVQFSYICQW
jgi:hypothetical protein